jgi:hypothetical protein
MKIILILIFFLAGCNSEHKKINEEDIKNYFNNHKTSSSAFMIVKNSKVGGDASLAVIFGLMDNQKACEELIAPYNKDPSMSIIDGVYRCEKLN